MIERRRTGSLAKNAVDVQACCVGCLSGFGDGGSGTSLGLVDGVIDILNVGEDEQGKKSEEVCELHGDEGLLCVFGSGLAV